jgi:hypothetical protein
MTDADDVIARADAEKHTACASGSRDHDYTASCWGHAIGMKDGPTATNPIGRWMGHGPLRGFEFGGRMQAGDRIVVMMQSGKRGAFRIDAIDYFRDPPDMWSATVRFDGYVPPEPSHD